MKDIAMGSKTHSRCFFVPVSKKKGIYFPNISFISKTIPIFEDKKSMFKKQEPIYRNSI